MSQFSKAIPEAIGESDPNTGTSALREAICEEVNAACTEAFGSRIRAIVLTGSLARDEGTFLQRGDAWTCLGDAEFILVISRKTSLPSSGEISNVEQRVESSLLRRKIQCKVDLSAAYGRYLQHLPPHIFTLELRECGKVICGDQNVLDLIPRFSAQELELEDAWRLLCNRLIELLDFPAELASSTQSHSKEFEYRIQKLYLDIGASLLVFARAYVPGYQRRCDVLRRLSKEVEKGDEYPFDVLELSEIVSKCTEIKLSQWKPDEHANRLDPQEALRVAHGLWRWELRRLTGKKQPLADCQWIKGWMRKAHLRQRLRGWLVVFAGCTWRERLAALPRWVKLFAKATPRGCVYFVMSGIFFQSINGIQPGRDLERQKNARKLMSFLPVQRAVTNKTTPLRWEQLALDVAWNYRRFLVGTRA